VTFDLLLGTHGSSGTVLWMFAAFVVTSIVTRVVVRMIREGRGPFRNTTVGNVHVHHHVYGIFLMIAAGVGEFVYRPDTPWLQVLAVLFGAGCALTLDEFALWLYLDDVYWLREGRKSVDAVLIATVIGLFLVLGSRPFDDTAGEGQVAFAVTATVHLGLSLVAIVKGKIASGLIGLVVPFVALIAAVRLAKPGSPWARARYHPGSRRLARAQSRYRPDHRGPLDRVKDLLANDPARPRP
jgi:hypothetical protein